MTGGLRERAAERGRLGSMGVSSLGWRLGSCDSRRLGGRDLGGGVGDGLAGEHAGDRANAGDGVSVGVPMGQSCEGGAARLRYDGGMESSSWGMRSTERLRERLGARLRRAALCNSSIGGCELASDLDWRRRWTTVRALGSSDTGESDASGSRGGIASGDSVAEAGRWGSGLCAGSLGGRGSGEGPLREHAG